MTPGEPKTVSSLSPARPTDSNAQASGALLSAITRDDLVDAVLDDGGADA